MQHRTLNEMEAVARVTPIGADSKRALRRERLERLASLLDQHRGPLRLLSRIEYLPESERFALRGDNTPLTVAYRDPVLRAQGLASDGLGDAMEFFDLSLGEAHYLLCDCHVVGAVSSRVLAERVRAVARRLTVREIWSKACSMVRAWWPAGSEARVR